MNFDSLDRLFSLLGSESDSDSTDSEEGGDEDLDSDPDTCLSIIEDTDGDDDCKGDSDDDCKGDLDSSFALSWGLRSEL